MSAAPWFTVAPRELVRNDEYLRTLRKRLHAQEGIGRANVSAHVVLALLDSLEAARLSNLHNLAVAKEAMAATPSRSTRKDTHE